MAGIGSALESIHFYRRVPRDVSKGTPTGGLLSLFAAGVMAYLFFSDLASFFEVKFVQEATVDQIFDDSIRVSFNRESSQVHPACVRVPRRAVPTRPPARPPALALPQ